MPLVQPALNMAEPAFGAVVARQLSAWPFAARTMRLFLLVDLSLPEQSLHRGLLRAMQEAYFRSDGLSQTRAVREAALAAHYVLRHRNREALAPDQVNAAVAVGALRGETAFVALAGDAAAFAWSDGALSGQRGRLHLPRPLGLEQDPRITLWSTPVATGDRLVLVCGAEWRHEVAQTVEQILGAAPSCDVAEQQLAEALGGSRPAGVLVVEYPDSQATRRRHLTLLPAPERPARAAAAQATRKTPGPGQHARSLRRRVLPLLGLVLLAVIAAMALKPSAASSPLERLQQAQALLVQADQASDVYAAHALAATALDLASGAGSGPGSEGAQAVLADASRALEQIDRVYAVSPAMAVRLGPAGGNVVDLAIGEDALYTLDVVEASVRAFALDAVDQQPTPDTLIARTGTPIGTGGRRLATPVAIRYLTGVSPAPGGLTIIDQARSVVQVARDGALSVRSLPGSADWLELGALASDDHGSLYVLDSGARRLLQYAHLSQRAADPPLVRLDSGTHADLALERAAELVADQDSVYLRLDDGTVRRFDAQGNEEQLFVRPPDNRATAAAAIAPDHAGGLYLADPAHARIVEASFDGGFVRQFTDPALAGLRQIQSSTDGRRLYGLVASGVLVFDVPPL